MKLFIDIVLKRIYLFNIVAWNYRKKIGFPVCKKENFAGLQAHRKRGKSARASPTPHHTLNEERSARFTAQHLSALVFWFSFSCLPSCLMVLSQTLWRVQRIQLGPSWAWIEILKTCSHFLLAFFVNVTCDWPINFIFIGGFIWVLYSVTVSNARMLLKKRLY